MKNSSQFHLFLNSLKREAKNTPQKTNYTPNNLKSSSFFTG